MKTDITITYKICLLGKKIHKIKKSIPAHRHYLADRSIRYHKGRLNIDTLMNEFEKKKDLEIFSIKREIVKLKNID
jgi:hypothetical protein